jgi:hypothetical protein
MDGDKELLQQAVALEEIAALLSLERGLDYSYQEILNDSASSLRNIATILMLIAVHEPPQGRMLT